MESWEKRNIERWSRTLNSFSKSGSESGAKYPPHIGDWVNYIELETLLEVVKPSASDRVIDLGAGGGRFTVGVAPFVSHVTAIEPSELYGVLASNVENLPNVVHKQKRIQDVQCVGDYSIAIISGVLMYMPDNEARKCLEIAATALREGGSLVLREPVARGGIVNVDWKYYASGNHPEITSTQYFEQYRDQRFYTDFLRQKGLRHVKTVISHAPVFHFTSDNMLASRCAKRLMQRLLSTKTNYGYMKVYNKICRLPYAVLMDVFKKKTMRLLFYKKQ